MLRSSKGVYALPRLPTARNAIVQKTFRQVNTVATDSTINFTTKLTSICISLTLK